MSKRIILAIAIIALMMFAGPAMAATVTSQNSWAGTNSNHHAWHVSNAGPGADARQDVWTSGSNIAGTQDCSVTQNTAYPYMNVDQTTFQVNASVANGGYMEMFSQRLDSYVSYGPAGQTNYAYAGSSDGTAEIVFKTWNNYAAMKECNYGAPTTTNGRHFEASGSSWYIEHSINRNPLITDPVTMTIAHAADAGVGKSASVWAYGISGSGMIKCQGGQANGSQSFNMGHLPVCGDGEAWDDNYAKFDGTGVGHLRVDASSDTGLSIHQSGVLVPGTVSDPAHYYAEWDYAGTFNYPDFGVKSQ